jgi:hypothetical protein
VAAGTGPGGGGDGSRPGGGAGPAGGTEPLSTKEDSGAAARQIGLVGGSGEPATARTRGDSVRMAWGLLYTA